MPHDLMRDVRVAPSILSADFARLGEQVEQVMDAGARVIHVDVMDGHFVPPITIGDLIVKALRDLVHERGGVLDVHLMVERPERRVEEFAAAGADTLIVHWEATPHVHYALKAVRDAGLHSGARHQPGDPARVRGGPRRDVRPPAVHDGQPRLGRPALHRDLRPRRWPGCASCSDRSMPIEVDGGIDAATARACRDAGATLFVAGSSIFGATDPAAAYAELAAAAGAV